eukprot:2321654-Pyramimonas_sp.AAC.1
MHPWFFGYLSPWPGSDSYHGGHSLDVVQAFYRTIRELVVRAHHETDLDDLTIATLVRAAGLPPAAMHQLAERLRQRSDALSRFQLDPHTVAQ